MFEDLMENMDSDFRSFYGISNKLLTKIIRRFFSIFWPHNSPMCIRRGPEKCTTDLGDEQ